MKGSAKTKSLSGAPICTTGLSACRTISQNRITESSTFPCITEKPTTTFPVHDIYFFETEGREIRAHTADKLFVCPYKLYELEDLLPGCFMRISKSSIANMDHIYSITRNLTASSIVEFTGSNKHALVSRGYYKALTERLHERKLGQVSLSSSGRSAEKP